MATSPPLGSIQWNLRVSMKRHFQVTPETAGWSMPTPFGLPNERENLPAKNIHLINLRPTRNNELAHADLLVGKKGVGQLLRRSQQSRPDGTVVRGQPGPDDRFSQCASLVTACSLSVHLGIVFEARRALLLVLGQQRLGDADSFLPRRLAYQAQPQTDTDPAFTNTRHHRLKLFRSVDHAQPACTL